jgi:hypothetical protein
MGGEIWGVLLGGARQSEGFARCRGRRIAQVPPPVEVSAASRAFVIVTCKTVQISVCHLRLLLTSVQSKRAFRRGWNTRVSWESLVVREKLLALRKEKFVAWLLVAERLVEPSK